jgi:hypothetical protein
VEGAFVFLDNALEDWADVLADGNVPAEGFYFKPTQVELFFSYGALEID